MLKTTGKLMPEAKPSRKSYFCKDQREEKIYFASGYEKNSITKINIVQRRNKLIILYDIHTKMFKNQEWKHRLGRNTCL